MPKQNFYAVRTGRKAGVYLTWDECEAQIKQYQGAVFKKFPSAAEAEAFVTNTTPTPSTSKGSAPTEDKSRGQKRTFSRVADESEWVVTYCDGACKGNGREGSIAGIGVFWGPNDPRNIAERCPGEQTNNRAELIAIIRALETAPVSKKKLLIKTDSQYSINCFELWLPKWQKNNFFTAEGHPVKNVGIIRYLSTLLEERGKRGQQVRLQYVKGHSGDAGNDGADAQANLGVTLPSWPEPDWGAMEAQASETTEALVQTATKHAVVSQALAGSSVERPAKIPRGPAPTSTEPALLGAYHNVFKASTRARTPVSASTSPVRPPRSPLRTPTSTSGARPTIYQKAPPIHEDENIKTIPPPAHNTILPHTTTESPTSQSVGTHRTPTSVVALPTTSVFPRSPLKVSKVAPPLVPVSAKEIDFDMYKDCLLEGNDWEQEIQDL